MEGIHNDFLIGLMDANIPDHAGEVYRDLLPQFEMLAKKESPLVYQILKMLKQ